LCVYKHHSCDWRAKGNALSEPRRSIAHARDWLGSEGDKYTEITYINTYIQGHERNINANKTSPSRNEGGCGSVMRII